MARFHNAFISYGRLDSKSFAEQLCQRLTEAGLAVWFDFNDIPLGVDYQNEIDDGIENSHNFLFVISPHSVNSPYCRKELDLAIACGKRIIPLMHVEKISRETWQQRSPQGTEADWTAYIAKGLHDSFTNMHPLIGKLNWVFFRQDQDDFEGALASLHSIFERQQDYVHQHTGLLSQALHWQRQQKLPHFLLVGEARQQAEAWLLTQFMGEQAPCTVIDLQAEYISESRKNANNLMTDVFLAYAEEDREVMEAIRSLLWRAGLTVWTSKTDIQTGEAFQQAIDRGIEAATNLVYLLSPASLASPYCQHELHYALSLHKRVIPLQVRLTDPATVPGELQELQYIDLADVSSGDSLITQCSQLLKILHQDAEYYETHKQMLVKALKWERQHHNPSILLRGYNLRHGESWLRLAQKQWPDTGTGSSHHGPVPLQVSFIEESLQQPPATALDVFVSYSRADSGLARQINDALQMQGKTTWFDQESIAAGSADFEQEIYRGIAVSDNFLFILSPTSIASPYCANEVAYAAQLHKRVLTVLGQPIDPALLPPELAKVQWIDFTTAQTDFTAHFIQLVRTLDTDRDHVHSHTKWSQRALEWEAQERTEDLLLRGNELAIAQSWLQEAQEKLKRPLPTELQKDFIHASQSLKDQLQQEEADRHQRELAQAQQLAQAADAQRQAEAEARLHAERRAEQEAKARRASQRTTLLTAIGTPLLTVLVLATGLTWRASQVDEIESLAVLAEGYLRDHQAFDALVATSLAGLKLKQLWLFPPQHIQSQIDGALRQADQDVRERNRLQSSDTVWDVDLSPDERYLAIAHQDGTVQLWDMAQQQAIHTFKVTDKTDGSFVQVQFAADGQSLITVAEGTPVQRWDLMGRPMQTYEIPGKTIIRAGVAPDGKVAVGSLEGTVRVWTASGQVSHSFEAGGPVTDVAMSADGRYLVATRDDGAVHLWSLLENSHQQMHHQGFVSAATFSPDGTSVFTASWDKTLRQWDLQGKELHQWSLDGTVMDIDLSSDGRTLVLAFTDGRVAMWKPGESISILGKHQDAVNRVQLSRDGRMVVSGSSDRTVRLWDATAASGPAIKIPTHAFVKDVWVGRQGGYLLAQDPDDSVKLWTLTGKLIAPLDPGGDLRGAAFSPTGDRLATGTADGIITFWDLQGHPIHQFTAHTSEIVSLRFSPDGQFLASASADQTATLWDLQGHSRQTFSGHTDWVNHVSFSPDKRRLATTSADQTALLWTLDGRVLHQLKGHQDGVLASAFSPNGKLIATASKDRTVKIWDVETGAEIGQLIGHVGSVVDIMFINNSDYLVTTSDDGTARLWNVQGQELSRYRHYNAAIRMVRASADGQFLATLADNGTARLWRIDSFDHLLAQACQRIQPYLAHSSQVAQQDRHRCDRWLDFPKSK